MSQAAPAPRRIAAQFRMEARLTLRNPESLLVTFGIPLVLLVFFSAVDVLPTGEIAPVRYLFPAVLALSVMSAAMVSLGIATGFERSYLVLKRLGATPLRRWELITAKIGALLAIEVVQVAVLAGTALALGWRAQPGAKPWLALPVLLAGTAAFAGLGLAMAGRLRAVGTLAAANTLYVVLLLGGGIAVPLERLPGPMATAARFTPSAPLVELLRGALDGSAVNLAVAAAVLLAWAVGACVLASVVFRWE